MIRLEQIYWVAGFLDGEGCFKNFGSPCIQINQTDSDLVQKFEDIVKSGLAIREKDPRKFNHSEYYTLAVSGIKAIGWMMTIYPIMSKRRQAKIREIIAEWKLVSIRQNGQDTCTKGHPLREYGEHYFLHANGSKVCRICHRIRTKANHKKRKVINLNNKTEIISSNEKII